MGQIASHLAEPAVYTHNGVDYKVSPWTFQVQGAFERYLEKYAFDAYYRVAPYMAPDDAEKALGALTRDVAAGRFTFGSEAVGKALESPVHVRYLMFLCIKKNHPEVTQALVEEMAKADYQGMIRAMNLANQDPNRRPPAEAPAAGGSPTTSSPEGPPPTGSANA